jgi:hypothetical protein
MAKFKKGDTVVYDDKEYIVKSYDEINEEWVITNDEEEVTVDEDLLLTVEEYNEILDVVGSDDEDEIEEDYDEEDDDEDEIDEDFDEDDLEEVKAKDRSFDEEETFEEETAAAKTIQTKPSAATDSSKAAMMSNVVQAMGAMSKGDAIDFFNKMMAQIGQEAKDIPSGAAAQNKNSVATKPSAAKATQTEEFKEIISGVEGLSEEVQDKLATLFDSAVHLRVTEIQADLAEAYDAKLEEEIESITEDLTDQVDRYLSHVAEEWVKENEVAIESNLRTEITENFMVGLYNLFEENHMYIPEEKVDVVEELATKLDELENKLNEQIEANISLVETLEEYNAEEIFSEVAEGLAMTQVEKLRTLVEAITYNGDEDEYRNKLKAIKEAHFKVKAPNNALNEEVELEEEGSQKKKSEIELLNPRVASYAEAISKTQKTRKL